MSEQKHTPEPFGFFVGGPFGWSDCDETVEGSIPLFDEEAINALEKQRDGLRAALELAIDHIDMAALEISHCKDAAAIRAAIASVKVSSTNNIGDMVERECCGTFFRTPHRSTCPNFRGKKVL